MFINTTPKSILSNKSAHCTYEFSSRGQIETILRLPKPQTKNFSRSPGSAECVKYFEEFLLLLDFESVHSDHGSNWLITYVQEWPTREVESSLVIVLREVLHT